MSPAAGTSSISVTLTRAQEELWKRFSGHTTEMVVTKAGRKMFPKLEYRIDGLVDDAFYALVLQIVPVDNYRYKFSGGEWQSCGTEAISSEAKKVFHADGVMSGRQWMSGPINFDRVKITNNTLDTCPSHIYLQSMHKYIPVLSIFESPNNSPFVSPSNTNTPICQLQLPFTEFIAVTAYQNNSITQLKIANNPFAKGFRESDRKRSSPENSQLSSPPAKRASPYVTPQIHHPFTPLNPIFYNPMMNPFYLSQMGPFGPALSFSVFGAYPPPPIAPKQEAEES